MADDISRIIIEASFMDLASETLMKITGNVRGMDDALVHAEGSAGFLKLGLVALGVAAVGALGFATDAANNLQNTLAEVQVNTGATTDDMNAFKDSAQSMQSSIGANMDQMAQGFRQAFDVTKNLNIALAENQVATQAAVASHGDASIFTNALATAMHEYQLDLDKTTGKQLDFAQAMNQSNATMGMLVAGARDANATLPQFTEYLSRASVEAAQMGVPMGDVEAGLAAMTRHGYSTDMAATQLRGIFSHVQRPPTKMEYAELQGLDTKTEEALAQKYGTTDYTQYSAEDQALFSPGKDTEVTGAMGSSTIQKPQAGMHVHTAVEDFSAEGIAAKGLTGVLADLTKQYDLLGYSDVQRSESAGKLVAAQRGGIGLGMLLTKAYSDYGAVLADVNNTEQNSTLVTDILNTQQKTTAAQLADLRGEALTFAQTIGGPMNNALGGWLSGLNAVLKPLAGELPDAMKSASDIFAGGKGRQRERTGASPQDIQGGAAEFQDISPLEKGFETLAHGIVIARDTVKTFFEAVNGGWKDDSQIVGVTRVFGNLGTIVRDVVIPNFLLFIGTLTTVVIPALDKLGQFIVGVSAFLREHEDILRVLLGVYTTIRAGVFAYHEAMTVAATVTRVFTAAQAAMNLVLDANPVMLVIGAIVALGVGFYELYQHNKTFHDFVVANLLPRLRELGNWFTGVAWPAIQQFGAAVETALMPKLQQLGTWMTTTGLPALQRFGEYIGPRLLDAGRATWTWISGTAIPALQQFGEYIGPKIASAVQQTVEFFQTRLIPAVKAVVSWFVETGIPAFRDFAESVGDKLSAFGTVINDKVVPPLMVVAKWIQENVIPQLQALGGWLQTTVLPLFEALGELIKTVIETKISPAWDKLKSLFYVSITWIADFSGAWDKVKELFAVSVTWIASFGDFWSQTWDEVKRIATVAFETIAVATKLFFDQWGPYIKGAFTIVLDIMHLLWDTMDNAVRVAWDIISTIIDDTLKIITGVIKLATDLIKGNWSGAWNDIKDILSAAWDIVKTVVGDVMSTIGNTISNGLATVKDVFGTVFTSITGSVKNLWHDWSDVFGNILDAMHQKVTDIWNGIKKIFVDAEKLITAAILAPFEGARDAIGGIMDGFKKVMSAPWNLMAGGIDGFMGGIVDALNWVSDKLHLTVTFDKAKLPHIPQFATGGTTPGGPIIAGENGRELIMPPMGSRVYTAQETIDIFRAVNHRGPEGAPMANDGGFLALGRGAGPWDNVKGVFDNIGGLVGDVAGGVRDFIAGGAEKIWELAKSAMHVPNLKGAGIFGDVAGGITKQVGDMAIEGIKSLIGHVSDLLPKPEELPFGPGILTGAPANYPGGNAILDMAVQTPGAYMWCEKFVGDVMSRLGLRYWRAPDAETHSNAQPLNGGIPPTGAVVFYPWDGVGHVNIAGPDGSSFGTVPGGTGWRGPGAFGPAKGWTTNPYAAGGMITEPVLGVGLHSGESYSFGEDGPEMVIPAGSQGIGAGGVTYTVRAHTVAAHSATNAYGTTYNVAAHTVAAHTATRSQPALSTQHVTASSNEGITGPTGNGASPAAIAGTTNTLIDAANAIVKAFQDAAVAVENFVGSFGSTVSATLDGVNQQTASGGQAVVNTHVDTMNALVAATTDGGDATKAAYTNSQDGMLAAATAFGNSLVTQTTSTNSQVVSVDTNSKTAQLNAAQAFGNSLVSTTTSTQDTMLAQATAHNRELSGDASFTQQSMLDSAIAHNKELSGNQDYTQKVMLDAATAHDKELTKGDTTAKGTILTTATTTNKKLTDDQTYTQKVMLDNATAFGKTLVTTYDDANKNVVAKVAAAFDAFTTKAPQTAAAQQKAIDAQWWNSIGPTLQSQYKINPVTGLANPLYKPPAAAKQYAGGGWITEPVYGYGQNSGQSYSFGEDSIEAVLNPSQLSRRGGNAQAASTITVPIYVTGSVVTEKNLVNSMREGFRELKRRGVDLGF